VGGGGLGVSGCAGEQMGGVKGARYSLDSSLARAG
jgi:hypothetical protein